MIVNPFEGIASIEENPNNITVTIPVKKSWFKVIFYLIWLLFWGFGGVVLIYGALNIDAILTYRIGYALFILIFFSVIAFYPAISAMLWELYGKEIITLDKKKLCIKSDVRLLSWKKDYYLNNISQMEIYYHHLHYAGKKVSSRTPGYNSGKIRFLHRKKPIRFGNGIYEVEAKRILEIFKESDHTSERNFT